MSGRDRDRSFSLPEYYYTILTEIVQLPALSLRFLYALLAFSWYNEYESNNHRGGCDESQETVPANDWLGIGHAAFGRVWRTPTCSHAHADAEATYANTCAACPYADTAYANTSAAHPHADPAYANASAAYPYAGTAGAGRYS
jgi:hypothetical protein